jgi:hypothetical protein
MLTCTWKGALIAACLLIVEAVHSVENALGSEPRGPAQVALVRIAPGTLIANRPLRSWSHFILESLPRLASGDLVTLPRSAARTAGLFRTVILADVGQSTEDERGFVLRRIGVGLCVPDLQGHDVVVTSEQVERLNVDLGIMDKVVLKAAEAELLRGRIVASTPTFALYRAPAAMAIGDAHHEMLLSYAFLVDPDSGALKTLVWAQEASNRDEPPPGILVQLAPHVIFDCPIDVKARRLLGAVPVSWSFAMSELPPGRQFDLTANRAQLLTVRATRSMEPRILEQTLRKTIAGQAATAETVTARPSGARDEAGGSGPGR